MAVCGIIAEYNPFHTGHAHQLAETRRLLGAETPIVCAMSGNFVQRGEFALLDKYARAETAVRCGIDLVIELPLAAALSSAEGFARGAIAVLSALGCDTVSFGAETPNTALLRRAAAGLDALEQTGFSPDKGQSYAAARQAALRQTDKEAAALLDSANNTLAVEYCRAMLPRGMHPLAIARQGAAHDAAAPQDGYASASHLRALLCDGFLNDCLPYLPAAAQAVLIGAINAGDAPVRLPEQALLALLRRLLYENRLLTGSADGFDERLRKAVFAATDFADAVSLAQTRCFPAARVRRALLRLALGVPADASPLPQYLRVLALNPQGRALLKNAATTLPVITKPAAERRLPAALQPALALDAFADDLFSLALPAAEKRAGGAHYRKTPFCSE